MKSPRITFRRGLVPRTPSLSGPDWKQANPRAIGRALERALAKPCGGWYVVGASRLIGARPTCMHVHDRPLVLWRDQDGKLQAGPNDCPHMGASLSDGQVEGGKIICPWHGLALGGARHGPWRPLATHDDGVLAWVRLDDVHPEDELLPEPVITHRPTRFVDGVIRIDADCEPRDVIANRLDPWHGVHFHPYSFGSLSVLDKDDDSITVRVAKRIVGPIAIEVDARFHCPDPRTIVMTIVAGEGKDSVVETHATPIAPGRTAIIEATLATSNRLQFRLATLAAPLVRPFIERSARRLWVDDAAYAERLYSLRSGDTF